MTYQIKIAARKEFESKELWEMHRLRTRIFKERMGWEVPILSGMEIDGYDALDPYYMMIREPSKGMLGCWRALPTEGPYMLKDTFPELLYGQSAPQDPRVWELSRFAIEAEGPQGFGFSGISLDVLREIVTFGHKMGIERYVMATTVAIERLMRRAGFAVTRFGPPTRIGIENAVALNFELNEQTHTALFGKILAAA
jgi:acyl homoserine lactone synthase